MRNKLFSLTTLLILASIVLTACGTVAYAQTESAEKMPRTLSVTGSGKAYLVPDIAYISIGVHTEDKDAAKAVTANNTQSQKVSEALKAFKIDSKDPQTTNFSIYPQQQYDENGRLTGILYMVDNSVYVTLRDLKLVGELLNKVVEAGANSINGIQFDVSDKTKALSEARMDAVANAQEQAAEIADASGVKLGEVMSINVYGGYPSPIFEGKGGGAAMMDVAAPISPGQMVLTVEVNMVFELK